MHDTLTWGGSRFAGFSAALGLAALLFTAREARATDFYLEGQVAGGGSTWRSDGNGQGALRAGFEFAHIVGIEAQGRLGYATVDERLLMGIGIGARLAVPIKPVTPYFRAGMIHFHEEPVAAAHHDWGGAIAGVGDGIRHRFGIETALGAEWSFKTIKKTTLFAGAEAALNIFPDVKGPHFYGAGSLGLGLHYAL